MIDPANMSRELISGFAVDKQFIDLNRHLSDVGYHTLFSRAEGVFHERIEIDADYRAQTGCSVYTVESHVSFLREVLEGDAVSISFQVLDISNKAAHVLMALRNRADEICAYHECMLLHVKKGPDGPKPYPFGRYQLANLVQIFSVDKALPRPERAGTRIAIRRGADAPQDAG